MAEEVYTSRKTEKQNPNESKTPMIVSDRCAKEGSGEEIFSKELYTTSKVKAARQRGKMDT